MLVDIFKIHRFFTSAVFSVVVETAVALILIKFVFGYTTLSAWRITRAGIFATLVTIPYVWFVFPNMFEWPYATYIWYAEGFAVLVEMLIYRFYLKISWAAAASVSLFANLSSFLLGPWLRAHGWWLYW